MECPLRFHCYTVEGWRLDEECPQIRECVDIARQSTVLGYQPSDEERADWEHIAARDAELAPEVSP